MSRKKNDKGNKGGKGKLEKEDLKLMTEWFEKNKDHELNFLEKEAIKAVLRKSRTVGELAETALKLLKK